MLWFPHVNSSDETKKKVAVQIHTVLSTREYIGEKGRELVNTLITEAASSGSTKQPHVTLEWNRDGLANSLLRQDWVEAIRGDDVRIHNTQPWGSKTFRSEDTKWEKQRFRLCYSDCFGNDWRLITELQAALKNKRAEEQSWELWFCHAKK